VFAPPQDRTVLSRRTDQLEDNAWWLLKIPGLVKHKILVKKKYYSGRDQRFERRYSAGIKTQAVFFPIRFSRALEL